MATETEIKLRLRDGVRARIEALGFHVQTLRQLEADQLYDRASELRDSGQVLRLRTRGSRSTLTYKGPAQRAPHKSREEIELDVTDGPAFAVVLARLGYQPGFRYEKYRTTFAAEGEPGIITIDETPAGDFMEIEGPGPWIDKIALKLGYSLTDYITESYASLWRAHCKSNPKAVPSAMVF
ncbi:MAG: class IV adenylate cyclase [Bryobacteraceae bacterium]